MNNGRLQTLSFWKNLNKCQWIILGAQPVGVGYIALPCLWLAGKGSSKHLRLTCQQLGLVSPSPTDLLKSCQLQLFGTMPYSSWKMQYPVEIVLCSRGLLRKVLLLIQGLNQARCFWHTTKYFFPSSCTLPDFLTLTPALDYGKKCLVWIFFHA